jgi:tetratricopeptide (TPR) repeat protein
VETKIKKNRRYAAGKNPFSMHGRRGRRGYCLALILVCAAFAAAYLVELCRLAQYIDMPLEVFVLVQLMLAMPAVWFAAAQGARRCHDIGKSALYHLIPLYFLRLLFKRGNASDNIYGEPPRKLKMLPYIIILGGLLLLSGGGVLAVKFWRQADSEYSDADKYCAEGVLFYENRNYEMAMRFFQKAIEINPQDADAYFYAGMIYGYTDNNFPQAIHYFQKALELDSNCVDCVRTLNAMGGIYLTQKNYQQAISCLQKAITTVTDSTDYSGIYYSMGLVYDEQKDYLRAVFYYQKVVEADPDNTDAYNEMGYAYAHLQNYGEAIACIKKAIAIAPDDPFFMDSMGEIYDMQGNTALAVQWYRKAAALGFENAQKWLKERGYKW